MPAPRTTRTTTAPDTTAPDAARPDSTMPNSTTPDTTTPDTTTPDTTAPDAAGPDVTADDPGTQDGATDPTAPTVAGPDSPAPRASTRPRRGTRRPNATTATAAASDDTVPEPCTDGAPPDTAAPDPAAAEATTDDVTPATVGDTDTGDRGDKSPVADDAWAELRKQPGCTATELARSVPASRSVVLQLLNRWCAEGSVDTTPGATTRAATRYFALPSTLPAPAPSTVPPADTDHEPTATTPTATPHPLTTDDTTTGAGETTDVEPDVEPGTPDAATTPAAAAVIGGEPTEEGVAYAPTARTDTDRTNSSGLVRLGSGALHGMVEDFLREHPADEHGPVAVAKAICRSSGAVANALERMVGSGWAVRTSDKPKRYRIADATDDARIEDIPTDEPSTSAHAPGADIPAPDAPAVDAPAVDGPAATQNGPGRGRGARVAGRSGTDTHASGVAAQSSAAPVRPRRGGDRSGAR